MRRRRFCSQADLFQVDQPAIQLAAMERAKLLPLLRGLLLEVMFGAKTKKPSKESDHEIRSLRSTLRAVPSSISVNPRQAKLPTTSKARGANTGSLTARVSSDGRT
jgi:hypothetical protein